MISLKIIFNGFFSLPVTWFYGNSFYIYNFLCGFITFECVTRVGSLLSFIKKNSCTQIFRVVITHFYVISHFTIMQLATVADIRFEQVSLKPL